MADDKMPFIKWFPADWRADAELRMCGLAARGLWFEMLMIMHEAEPRGDLRVNGRQIGAQQLANLAGCGPKDAERLLAELEESGVFDRDEDGTIFCRRMRRARLRSETARQNGIQGGRPPKAKLKANANQSRKPEETQTETQTETQEESQTISKRKPLEARGQRLEARNQPEKNPQQPDSVAARASPTGGDEAAAGLVVAFDRAQDAVWGALRRQQPTGKDPVVAHRWASLGLTQQEAEPLFRRVFEGLKARNLGAPRSLAFIDGEVCDHIGRKRQKAQDAAGDWETIFGPHREWYPRLKAWEDRRQWPDNLWGPPPGQPKCRVPQEAFEAWERMHGTKVAA